ncbi:MAG: VOC family protein [Actinomycetota bacterium]|jgi:hypothetical protein|nr:VOC family protein [Actinomycetota bacterium]
MAYEFQVTFDAARPHVLADWWAETLGWIVEPTDEPFIRRMIAEGFATEDATMTHNGALVWREGAAITAPADPVGSVGMPRVLFQLVPGPKTVKNRLHLDVRVGADEVESVAERLAERGATFLHRASQGPHSWITMADPEGNEFCVT